MKHFLSFVLLCAVTALPVYATADRDATDKELERANQLIETDPTAAVELCQKMEAHTLTGKQRAQLYHTLGNAYFAKGKSPEAKRAFHQAVEHAMQVKDTAIWASALSDLGVTYRVTERLDSALSCYNQALTLLERIDAPSEEAYLLTSIAVFYTNRGRLDEGAKYGRRAFATAKRSGDIDAIMYAGQTLGIVLYLKGEKAEGIAIEREIVGIAERRKLPRYTLKAYASIIDMHHKEGHRDSVAHYMAKGNKVMAQVPEASVEALGFLEESYVILTAEGKYRESLAIQERILGMRGAGTFMPFDRLYQRMARNYEKLGDMRRMGEAYERAIEVADSLHGLKIDQQLSEMDVKYETARRELQIAELKATQAQQRTWLVLISLLTLVLTVGLCIYFRMKKTRLRKRLELQALRDQLAAIDRERGRLAAELHDGVCSDLTGIALLMQTEAVDGKELTKLLDQVRNDVRSVSHELMPPRLDGMTLGQLLYDLQFKNQELIHLGELDDSKLQPSEAFHLYRIAQEWTGNVRKHGGATQLEITLKDGAFELTDNGKPMELHKGKGIGMESIRNRAQSIGGKVTISRVDGLNKLTVTRELMTC